MKWFTLLSYRTYIYRSIAALIFGIVALFVPNDTVNALVVLIGIFVLLAGLGTAYVSYKATHNLAYSFGGISSIVSILFGILLIVKPTIFVHFVMSLIGVILIFVGSLQIINVASVRSKLKQSKFYITGGVLPLIVGVVFLIFPELIKTYLGVFLGITLIIYSINEMSLGRKLKKFVESTTQAEVETEDTDYVEVEETEQK